MTEIRIWDKYWKCFIYDKKYSRRGLYKAELTNLIIIYLFKDHNIRESNKRKSYTKNKNNFKDDNFISDIIILSSAAGTVRPADIRGK